MTEKPLISSEIEKTSLPVAKAKTPQALRCPRPRFGHKPNGKVSNPFAICIPLSFLSLHQPNQPEMDSPTHGPSRGDEEEKEEDEEGEEEDEEGEEGLEGMWVGV